MTERDWTPGDRADEMRGEEERRLTRASWRKAVKAAAEAAAEAVIHALLLTLSEAQAELAELRADARRYRFLRDHHGAHYGADQEQPAEWSIAWEFRQHTPQERFGSFDSWIDADIAFVENHLPAALSAPKAEGEVG